MSSISNVTPVANTEIPVSVDTTSAQGTQSTAETASQTTSRAIPFHDLILPRNATTALGMRKPVNHGDTEAVFAELMLIQQGLQQDNVENALKARASELLATVKETKNNEVSLEKAKDKLEALSSLSDFETQDVSELQSQVTTKGEQKAELVAQQASASALQTTELQTEIDALDAEIATLETQISALQSSEPLDAQIDVVETEILDLETQIENGEIEVQEFFATSSLAGKDLKSYIDNIGNSANVRVQFDDRIREGGRDLSSLDARDQSFEEIRQLLNKSDEQSFLTKKSLNAIVEGLESIKQALTNIPQVLPAVTTGQTNTSSNATGRLELAI